MGRCEVCPQISLQSCIKGVVNVYLSSSAACTTTISRKGRLPKHRQKRKLSEDLME
jgi:hypothetical protein